MSEETYKRLSRKGRRRARTIRNVENAILAVIMFVGGFLAANGMGLLFKLLGV